MKPTEEQVKQAIQKILNDTKAYKTTLNYTVNYCQQAMLMSDEALRVQCRYILENLSTWRNPEAKEIRACLRNFSKP